MTSVAAPNLPVEHHIYRPWLGTLDCITTEGAGAECTDTNGDPLPAVQEWFSFDPLERLRRYISQRTNAEVTTDYTYDAFDRVFSQTESRGSQRVTEFSYVGLSDAVSQEEITGGTHSLKRYRYDAYLSRTGPHSRLRPDR